MGGAQVRLLPEHLGGGLSLTGQQTGVLPEHSPGWSPLSDKEASPSKGKGRADTRSVAVAQKSWHVPQRLLEESGELSGEEGGLYTTPLPSVGVAPHTRIAVFLEPGSAGPGSSPFFAQLPADGGGEVTHLPLAKETGSEVSARLFWGTPWDRVVFPFWHPDVCS